MALTTLVALLLASLLGCASPSIPVQSTPHLRAEASTASDPGPTLGDRIAKWRKHVDEYCVDPGMEIGSSWVTWDHKIWEDRRDDDPYISCGDGKTRLRYLLKGNYKPECRRHQSGRICLY